MWSVKNEAESFESAAVAAAREQMVTVCNVPASAEPMLGSQTTWRRWSCSARRHKRQLLQELQNEGKHCSSTKQAFFTPFEIGHSHGLWLCPN